MNVTIRKEEKKDYKKVYEVNCFAFQQEYESKLIEKIRKGKNFIPELSLVAEIDDEIVGHILFSRIEIVGDSVFDSLALAPMAVIPEFQKQGIGSKLIKKGIEKAKELGFDSIIVLGHKEYYPKFGFQKASKWNIKCPFEVHEEAFMAIELTEKAFEDKAGTVKYPDEFMEVE
ncbi:MAG: N-acetyltransferase [Methanocellales archaeon]|nr:N-acetyltransferase [Methanocellales archaeon]